jgi:CubicO group peptidase (beta-lactamase class C family)
MHFRIAAAVLAATVLGAVSHGQASEPKKSSLSPVSDVPTTPSEAHESSSPSSNHPLDSHDLEAWLDGLLPYALKSGDIAGGVVAVVKDGNILLLKGFGYADVGRQIPMDPERTMIRAGSTSKLFTWTAVMQLVEQGKLDLNRNVDEYLDFKVSSASGKPITLLDLMNHRAGFEEGLKDILATNPRGLESTETYLKRHPRPLLFPPGTVPAYSNYGAALAGYIVERVSGEPFERYVEQHIFTPLGMMHTTFDQPLPARFKDAVSLGYKTASMPPQPYELVVTAPAGSLATTAADMARFMIAQLNQGRMGEVVILNSQTARLMQSPSETALPGFSTMAHGFFYENRNGRTLIGHGGDTVLFHTELELLPEEHVGIFYNFNSRGGDNAVYGLRKALLDRFMDRYFPTSAPPTSSAPNPATASKDARQIAGRYQSSRRIEHGFLSLFYLLQQSVITSNPDGSISAPRSLEAGEDTFHEVAPNLWRQVDGTRQLAFQRVDNIKTVVDSEDPTSVLQAVPFYRSSALNLPILLIASAILALTVLFWPISWLVRRGYGVQSRQSVPLRRVRLYTRLAAAFDVLYLIGWMLLLKPVLSLDLQVYSAALDPVVRTLQLAGIAAIAAAAVGLWSTWRLFKLEVSIRYRLWNGALVAAMLGIVWIGFVGKLISFNLNY